MLRRIILMLSVIMSIIFGIVVYLTQSPYILSLPNIGPVKILLAGAVATAAQGIFILILQRLLSTHQKDRIADDNETHQKINLQKKRNRQKKRTIFKVALKAILSAELHAVTTDKDARACIFFRNKRNKREELFIFAHTEGFTEEEIERLRFTPAHRGIVGHVFWGDEDHRPQSINLDGIPPSELVGRWTLTKKQISLTRKVKYVVAAPIQVEENLIGVLSVDSLNPTSISKLDQNGVVDLVLEIARNIAEAIQELNASTN